MANEDHQPPGQNKSFDILVNGTQEVWTDNHITYEQVVQLAFPGGMAEHLFTVTFANPQGQDGTLAPGQKTVVKDRVSFTVVKTNRS